MSECRGTYCSKRSSLHDLHALPVPVRPLRYAAVPAQRARHAARRLDLRQAPLRTVRTLRRRSRGAGRTREQAIGCYGQFVVGR